MRKVILLSMVGLLLNACGKPDLGQFTPGLADSCKAMPPFVAKTGLGKQVAIDTQQRGYMGLRLLEPQTGRSYQHPTWDDAGHVGAFARDKDGNVYLAPTPDVSLTENPPALQNRIYRIDAQSGEMALWLELPAVALPSISDPFGAMGLFYDCDTQSLYVSSVAGSTANQVNGRIYRIDVASKQVVSQLEQTDALGIGVFNGVTAKRLYLGSARGSDVYSVVLDAKGDFTDEVRHEFALAALPDGNSTSVRKFDFVRDAQGQYLLQAKETEFGFRLMAENNLRKRMYRFVYEADKETWRFLNTVAENP